MLSQLMAMQLSMIPFSDLSFNSEAATIHGIKSCRYFCKSKGGERINLIRILKVNIICGCVTLTMLSLQVSNVVMTISSLSLRMSTNVCCLYCL